MIRNKLILIKGNQHLAERITKADFERVNVDRIVLIVALKYPSLSSHVYESAILTNREDEIKEVLNCLYGENDYLLAVEYTNMYNDHLNEIKVVEGTALEVDWFHDMIKTIHKNAGMKIVEVEPYFNPECMPNHVSGWKIDGFTHSVTEALELLNPRPELG